MPKIPQWIWLVAWFALSFIVLFVFPLMARHSFCPPEKPDACAIQGYEYPKQGKKDSKEINYSVTKQKAETNQKEADSPHSYEELLCGEVKVTDLALIFFTCGLVIVGYFTLRSADETAKKIERAYIFVEIKLRLFHDNVMDAEFGAIAAEAIFWNYGKTPAILRLIRAEILIQQQIPQTLGVAAAGDDKLPDSLGMAPNVSFVLPFDKKFQTGEFVDINHLNKRVFFVGGMEYETIFGEKCETSFCWELVVKDEGNQVLPCRESGLNRRT